MTSGKGQTDYTRLYQRLDEADRLLNQNASAAEKQKILATRAKSIAKARDPSKGESVEVLVFQVGGERYAAPIQFVEQVIEPKLLSSLPGVPRYVLGAMLARSRVIVVVDLRQLLGLEGGGMSDLSRVVVLSMGDTKMGVAAEVVEGRVDVLTAGSRKPSSGPFSMVTQDRLAVLDIAALGRMLEENQKG
ncbi:MAG: chemotaxis protein CheW [Myxococcaceae bacterium]